MPQWCDTFYVRIYELAKLGMNDSQIAESLGIPQPTFVKWKQTKPALRDAIERAKESPLEGQDKKLWEYVYGMLPRDLKPIWEKLQKCHSLEQGIVKIEPLLQHAGERARQYLFLHALLDRHYNPSEACRLVNISRRTLNHWLKSDEAFQELMEDINWHKGNFYESALIKSVENGEPSVVIFANKTFNRERGYGEKLQHQVEGNIQHQHSHLHVHVSVDELNLPMETRKQILLALRERENNLLEHRELPNGLREIPSAGTSFPSE